MSADEPYRLWTNDERTLLVRLWDTGEMEVCTRPAPDPTWGPPVLVKEDSP